jgi:hypothetical protein
LSISRILATVLAAARASAEDERVTEAQRRFEAGVASYHPEEYDLATEE